MGSKTYDRLKFTALVVLPGLSALYYTIAQIWGLPYTEQVMASVAGIDTFLGLVLRKSSKDFQKELEAEQIPNDTKFMGHLTIVQDVDGQPLQLRMDPKDEYPIFEDGTSAVFTVRRESMK